MGMLHVVVDVIEQHILHGHPAAVGVGLGQIAAYPGKEGLDVVLVVDRHDLGTQLVVRCMQGDGQGNVDLVSQHIQRRHHTGGGESDAALGDAEAEVIHHQLHGRYHVGEVEQRLTHAHHHHVGDGALAAHHFGGTPHLADDLGDFQVAVEPLLGGGAEGAGQGAAHLGGDAQGSAVRFRNVDGLHLLIAHLQRPFDGAIGGALFTADLGGTDLGNGLEPLAQRLVDVAHLIEIITTEVIDPLHYLVCPERLLAQLDEEGTHGIPVEIQQVGFCFAHQGPQLTHFINYRLTYVRGRHCTNNGSGFPPGE